MKAIVYILTDDLDDTKAVYTNRRRADEDAAHLAARRPDPLATLRLDKVTIEAESVADLVIGAICEIDCSHQPQHDRPTVVRSEPLAIKIPEAQR